MSASSRRDYEVGRGKPPVHTRFQPGQSGNPRGRPRGAIDAKQALQAALDERVTITENGRRVRRTKLAIAMMQAANKAAQGDLKAIAMLLKLVHQQQATQPLPQDAAATADACGTVEDDEVFAAALQRIREGGGS